MVYMEPHLLGWEPILESWLNTLPETISPENRTMLKDMFTRYGPCLLNFVRKGGFSENSPTSDANLIHSCMNLVDCQLSAIADPTQITNVTAEQMTAWIEVWFDLAAYGLNQLNLNFDTLGIVIRKRLLIFVS